MKRPTTRFRISVKDDRTGKTLLVELVTQPFPGSRRFRLGGTDVTPSFGGEFDDRLPSTSKLTSRAAGQFKVGVSNSEELYLPLVNRTPSYSMVANGSIIRRRRLVSWPFCLLSSEGKSKGMWCIRSSLMNREG